VLIISHDPHSVDTYFIDADHAVAVLDHAPARHKRPGRTNAHVIPGRTNAPVTAGRTILDTRVTDYSVSDSHVTDSSVTDSSVSDSLVTDTRVTDSSVSDSHITDYSVSDSHVTDSSVTDSSVPDSSVSDSLVTDSHATDSSVTDTRVTDSRVTDSPSSMHSPWGREGQHSHTRADQLTANAFHQDSLHATGGGRCQHFNASAFQGSSITALQRSSFSVSQQSKTSLSSTTDSQSIRIHGPAKLPQHSSFNAPASADQTALHQPHSNVVRQTMPSILLNGNTDIHDTSIQRSTVIGFHLNA